ncbi:hypothetical protein [Brevundimonas sp. 'scallop']|uniref:hypothetical protein n=1 Tax=Brevundimonas sp. 'scallop' TaxID=2562582 RepID=UPI0013E1E6D4|nr:hypothetical protein [Brevundimonas sp. 'scallop']QIF82423.1 hypothetical protein E4341_12340 [Brevundimonas sp. 'scallop']
MKARIDPVEILGRRRLTFDDQTTVAPDGDRRLQRKGPAPGLAKGVRDIARDEGLRLAPCRKRN